MSGNVGWVPGIMIHLRAEQEKKRGTRDDGKDVLRFKTKKFILLMGLFCSLLRSWE